MSSLNRKQKAMLVAGAMAFVLVVSVLSVQNIALQKEVLRLQEEMGINRESWISGATVYISVMRADESSFTLAHSGHNVMCTAGLNWIRDMLANQTTATSSDNTSHYIAIGTGSGGGAGSSALQSEFDRQIGTYAEPVAGNWTLTYTWTAGSFDSDTISEAGCINDSSGGVLLNYQDFTGILLNSGDSLQVQFEFQVS